MKEVIGILADIKDLLVSKEDRGSCKIIIRSNNKNFPYKDVLYVHEDKVGGFELLFKRLRREYNSGKHHFWWGDVDTIIFHPNPYGLV